MRRAIGVALLLCAFCCTASAVIITLFESTDAYIERAKHIIVAECISSIPPPPRTMETVPAFEVNILKVLKGNTRPGKLRIETIYDMKPHVTYMLYSLGAPGPDTGFSAIPELSVVPLPPTFKLQDLDNKDLKEQVQYMFSLRLAEVERQLAPLLKEKELLEKAVSDRHGWYDSNGPVKLGTIVESSTKEEGPGLICLDLEGEKLRWRQSSPGKSGEFSFQKTDVPRAPYWEFSPCDAAEIEDLANKPLRARFYGMHPLGRDESALGWTGLQGIKVEVGRVLLARTTKDPDKLFAIQIVGQAPAQKQMSARYTVIRR
jgi:hypothetical protein